MNDNLLPVNSSQKTVITEDYVLDGNCRLLVEHTNDFGHLAVNSFIFSSNRYLLQLNNCVQKQRLFHALVKLGWMIIGILPRNITFAANTYFAIIGNVV